MALTRHDLVMDTPRPVGVLISVLFPPFCSYMMHVVRRMWITSIHPAIEELYSWALGIATARCKYVSLVD